MKTIQIEKTKMTESQGYALELFVNAQASSMDAGQLAKVSDLILEWQPNTEYKEGDVRTYQGQAYKCLPPGHTSQTGWEPPNVPALWHEEATKNPEGVELWVQPMGAHDAYALGAKVCYPSVDGDVWTSTVDANVWTPGVYGWEKDGQGGGQGESGQTPTEPQVDPWVQPSGVHDAYSVGDRVTHNGKTWESTTDGNVWEPGVYGWDDVTE